MSLRIVFMGTPEFAVPSLDVLIQNGYNVVGVITSTDKMGGRGNKKLLQSAVKKYAVEKGLKVLQPKNLKHPDFIEELRSLKADLQVVVAFRMLPEMVWNMPPIGTINLHGSLLPEFRGAAPIHWAVINGKSQTGVTSFFLKHKIDTGDILLSQTMEIGP
ncbi:MAG: methionyl-tRNA formyltransferase, partial [Saprospiraceae bacterium]